MLPQSESNESQNSTHTVLEESKAKGDAPRDDLRKVSTISGTNDLIRLF